MNLTTINKKFKDYDLSKLNWVRLPNIIIKDEERAELGLPPNTTNIDFLKEKTKQGFENRKAKNQIIIEKENEYLDRIEEELNLVDSLGFCDYYLLVWRTIEYARKFTSYLDPARGSCGGSTIFFMIGVTQLDPVKHGLFLSRFISKARANKKIIDGTTYIQGDLAPDVDINFSKDIREKVINWLEQEYGGKMAQISTYTSFTTKILLKECYKALVDEGTEDEAKRISDCVQSKFGKLEDIDSVIENNEYFRSFCEKNPEIIKVARKLQNLTKSVGSHASGFVISFDPLEKISQLSLNKDNQLACVYEMGDISKLSLKLDLLGLTTNKIIDDCLKMIGKTYDDINLDDSPEIYRHFQDPYLGTGIYQIEKGCAYNVTRAVKPKNVSELSDVNALARPGALSYLSDYVNDSGECPHEIFRPILSTTRFQPLYQEQMIQMAIAIGFTPEEGEIIRRTSAKKAAEKMAEWESKVRDKCAENGYSQDVADYFWKLLKESADYSFNKCVFEDEEVQLFSGQKLKLKHVQIGDIVKCFNTRERKNEYRRVKNIYKNNVQCYTVVINNGSGVSKNIKCSIDHKFLCYLNGEFYMEKLGNIDINRHHFIVCENNHNELGITSYIESITKDKIRNTIDLEIDSEDHNFYVNGIVVSNSHSTGVSYVGALTAYLKYNYPKEFYTSFLNNCKEFPDFVEKTSSAIRELKHFGIRILAPDLLKSKDDFSIEDGGIRYGLRYIKGVSDNSLSQLAGFKQRYDNKFDVFKAIDDLKIKLNVVCPLIQAGALEHENEYGRTYCVFEAQVWKNLTAKEKNLVMEIGSDFNYDLPKCLRHLINTEKIKKTRAATLRSNILKYTEIYNHNKRYTDIVNWFYEYKLLGFSYSYDLVDVFKDFEKSKGRPSLFDFISLEDLVNNHIKYQEKTIRVVGIVIETIVKESKNGNKYMKCVIEDGKNKFDILMMDKDNAIMEMTIDQGRLPEKEDLICCQGRLSKVDDEDKIPILFADSIRIQKDVKVFMKLHDLKTYKKS